MITDFISLEIDLKDDSVLLHELIKLELQKYGKPLRWAITAVDTQQGKLILEAVVTKEKV